MESGETLGKQIKRSKYRVFKVRIRNTDIQKGKSSGYRMIYYLKRKTKDILVTIYSKTEQGDISPERIRRIITDFEE
jgi:mRNA-degrading endonuclease RelE of RelBE toxin-antitoxin system